MRYVEKANYIEAIYFDNDDSLEDLKNFLGKEKVTKTTKDNDVWFIGLGAKTIVVHKGEWLVMGEFFSTDYIDFNTLSDKMFKDKYNQVTQ